MQRELLEEAAALARRRIVYVTCSILRSENEDQAERFELQHPEWARGRPFVRTWPHREGCDAFFVAVWEKRAG